MRITRWLVAVGLLALLALPGPALVHGGVSFGLGIFLPLTSRPAALVYVPAPGPPGYLRAQVDPPTARVFVDGYPEGRTQDISGAQLALVPAGQHRLEIEEPGFLRHTAVLLIAPGLTTDVRIRLLPAPPAPPLAGFDDEAPSER